MNNMTIPNGKLPADLDEMMDDALMEVANALIERLDRRQLIEMRGMAQETVDNIDAEAASLERQRVKMVAHLQKINNRLGLLEE